LSLSGRRCWGVLVARYAGVYLRGPRVDTTSEIEYVRKAISFQKFSNTPAAAAGMAHHDERFRRVELGKPGGHLAHRDMQRALDAGDRELGVLAHVEQDDVAARRVVRPACSELSGAYLRNARHESGSKCSC